MSGLPLHVLKVWKKNNATCSVLLNVFRHPTEIRVMFGFTLGCDRMSFKINLGGECVLLPQISAGCMCSVSIKHSQCSRNIAH